MVGSSDLRGPLRGLKQLQPCTLYSGLLGLLLGAQLHRRHSGQEGVAHLISPAFLCIPFILARGKSTSNSPLRFQKCGKLFFEQDNPCVRQKTCDSKSSSCCNTRILRTKGGKGWKAQLFGLREGMGKPGAYP